MRPAPSTRNCSLGLLAEPYFAAPPPKSTGRDLFNAGWLDAKLARAQWGGRAENLQATLTHLTARTIADAVRTHAPDTSEVLACGGGARNAAVMRALAAALPEVAVGTTEAEGVATDHVEALAFAWLAREALAGRPGNLPAVTGASGPRVLGAIYPRVARHHRRQRGRAAAGAGARVPPPPVLSRRLPIVKVRRLNSA